MNRPLKEAAMDVDRDSLSDTGDGESVQNSNSILESFMLKKSSHNYWQERYFVFSPDNKLTYYHTKGSTQSRKSFTISREAGCEVSNLYVDQRINHNNEKELIYCFKITWLDVDNQDSTYNESHFNGSSQFRDDGSSVAGSSVITRGVAGAIQTPQQHSSPPSRNNTLDEDVKYLFEGYVKPNGATDSLSATPPRARSNLLAESPNIATQSSEDGESLISNNHNGGTESTKRKKKKKGHFLKPSWTLKSKHKRGTNSLSGKEGEGSKTSDVVDKERPVEVLFPPVMPDSSFSEYEGEAGHTRAERVQRMYAEQELAERNQLQQQYVTKKKQTKKERQKKVIQGTKLAVAASTAAGVAILTAGVGLVAGLVVIGVGAAAGATGGGASMLGSSKKGHRSEIIMATPSYEDAKLWKSTLDAHLEYENLKETTWGRILFAGGNKNKTSADLGATRSAEDDDGKVYGDKSFLFEPSTQWGPLEGWCVLLLGTGTQGLRVFREEKRRGDFAFGNKLQNKPVRRILTNLSVDGETCSPMKAQVVLNTSPLDAFMCIMSYARMMNDGPTASFLPQSEQSTSFRVIESIDDHMDVIHLVSRPIYLFPSWTAPRDFVLCRFFLFEPDGTYVVCYESVQHRDCPPIEGFVRGEMHQAYTVSPRKKMQVRKGTSVAETSNAQECLLTAVVQVDPKGWVPIAPLQAYGDAFGIAALLQLLDIRDAIDRDRFNPVAMDIEPPAAYFRAKTEGIGCNEATEVVAKAPSAAEEDTRNYDFSYASRESLKIRDSPSGLRSTPPPFDLEKWAEPDANSFRVRGPTYKTDRQKINAGESIARLVAVDIVQVDEPIYTGMATHPTERIQLALKKEEELKAMGRQSDVPPFIFVLNIVLPGEPLYHAVFYYAVDNMREINGTAGTPTSKLCNRFFFGDSDSFRDRTFKLIPQIVQGNFMVRKAVGSTPAIMGKKLKQLYVRGERFFEIILDCGSSSVAAGVIRLSLGYAKTIVVDLGFLFEGDDETVLPERIFGCVRIKNPDFSMPIRKVKALPPEMY